MRYFLFLILLGVTAAGVLYWVPSPSPRITFGDPDINEWIPAQFSPDGKTILARGYNQASGILGPPHDSVLKLWDAATGQYVRQFQSANVKSTQRIDQVGFSHDGKHVFACGQDRALVMWEKESGKEVRAFHHEGNFTQCFSLTPDGSQVLTVTPDRQLLSWEVLSGKLLNKATMYPSYVASNITAILFSKNADYFVLVDRGRISVWDFVKLELVYSSTPAKARLPEKNIELPWNVALQGFALTADMGGILYSTNDGKITELNIASAKAKQRFELKTDKDILVLTLSRKGDRILTTGFHGQARLYSFPECKELKRFPGYGRVQLSPDGKAALTFTKKGRMMLWDLED